MRGKNGKILREKVEILIVYLINFTPHLKILIECAQEKELN